jgi:hypothetical protein
LRSGWEQEFRAFCITDARSNLFGCFADSLNLPIRGRGSFVLLFHLALWFKKQARPQNRMNRKEKDELIGPT